MFICYLLVVIGELINAALDAMLDISLRFDSFPSTGHGVQGTPNGYMPATATTPATSLEWTVWSPPGTTFVQGMNAALNIAYVRYPASAGIVG